MAGVVSANAGALVEEEWPEDKPFVMSRHGVNEVEAVRALRGLADLVADQRPDLPAAEQIACAEMDDGIDVVVSDDVALASAGPDGEEHEFDVIAEETVRDVPGDRNESSVVKLRNLRALLKVEWEKGEAMKVRVALGAASRK